MPFTSPILLLPTRWLALRASASTLPKFSLCLLVLLCATKPAAYAADPPSARDSGKAAPEGRHIEDVVVTAERREASVQDTSISITAFTGAALEQFGIRNQTDLQSMVPATTIQPYDSAIRGVGRNFRNLGGDPGIATYMNGVYSEDLYTATIGSFWDIERIEILRGPQGTLYGRNAVGGAMNFIYGKPTDDFDAKLKTTVGNYNTHDFYGMVNAPLWKNILSARLTGSTRKHDGYVREKGQGPDLDSGNEQNLALSLKFTPLENLEFNIRDNEARVNRVMGGADGGGLVILHGETFDGKSRDFSRAAFGYREISRTQTDATQKDFFDASNPVFKFTNPRSGQVIEAQNLRPGVDPIDSSGFNARGFGNTASTNQCAFTGGGHIKGSDECATTNGLNVEKFNQHGIQTDATWDISDKLRVKYIYGYNDLTYQRITDDDSTDNHLHDRQFYVNHEATYFSHELQAFYEINDALSFTSGLFRYDASIQQRGDFFSTVNDIQFTQPANDLGLAAAVLEFGPMVHLHTARDMARAANTGTGELVAATGVWSGDPGGTHIEHGPNTAGTDLEYDTTTRRQAEAAYTQGVWDINPRFTLTFGVRYAIDKLEGEENLFRYTEVFAPDLLGNNSRSGPLEISLADYNVIRGALDPTTLKPTGVVPVNSTGIPFSLSVWRSAKREDKKFTGRLNLDWKPNDTNLMYFSVTTGYRSGGFNLVFFSQTAQFNPEKLIAYEVGYKGTMLDGSLRVDGAMYFYDYSNINTFGTEPSLAGGLSTSVLDAPGARIYGLEVDVLWLATEKLSLGGNLSYTPSKYTKSLKLADDSNPASPPSLFAPADLNTNIKGNQLLQVPESKGSLFATYDFNLNEYGKVQLLGAYSFISDVYFSPFQSKVDKAPAYDRFDLRATWTSPSAAWTASAYVDNVFDKLGVRQILRNGEAYGFNRNSQLTEPRQIGAEFTYIFGSH